jgi:hypothetical protein
VWGAAKLAKFEEGSDDMLEGKEANIQDDMIKLERRMQNRLRTHR